MLPNIKFKLITFLILVICSNTFGQMTLRFPVERTVFQRNTANVGAINITGNLTKDADLVEARLLPRISGQGTFKDWTTIDSNISGLNFTGQLMGNGGWYTLEIRSKLNGNVLESITLDRVGIGEVFAIAGQSNASGFNGDIPSNARSATDDRVIAAKSINISNSDMLPSYQFFNISGSERIAPNGASAWCYGSLGDLLVSKLNVPILFFNAGYPGTAIINWYETITKPYTYLPNYSYPYTMPYGNLRNSLHNNINLLGLRAILWHQGEYESGTSTDQYVNLLQQVISASRNDAGFNIPWVVCRATRLFGITLPWIIDAQNRVIANTSGVFEGPATDDIQPNRPDGAHFANTSSQSGLVDLANAWNSSLNDGFFNNSNPKLASTINEIAYTCNSDNTTINISMPSGFSSYNWNTGSNYQSYNITYGSFMSNSFDNAGIVAYSNKFNFNDANPRISPYVYGKISNIGCIGKTVEFVTDAAKYPVIWNNGGTGNSLKVSDTQAYYARYKSNNNCYSVYSNQVFASFVAPPSKPVLRFTNGGLDGAACLGEQINISVDNPNSFQITWTTGATNSPISIYKPATSPIKATLYSNWDCPSVESDPALYHFVSYPKTPTISISGPYSLEAISDSSALQYKWYSGSTLSQTSGSNLFFPSVDGTFKVKAANIYKTSTNRNQICETDFSNLTDYKENTAFHGITIYPNPIVDNINIASKSDLTNVSYKLYNSVGQLLQEGILGDIGPKPSKIPFVISKTSDKLFLRLEIYGGLYRVYPLIMAQQ